MRTRNRLLVILAMAIALVLLTTGFCVTAFAEGEDNLAFKVTTEGGVETTYEKSASLSTTLANAPAGSTITLLADADIDTAVDLPSSITVDLNSFSVTTTARLTPKNTAHIIFKNGTIDVTKTELIYMNEWGSQDATFELNNVTVKKGETAENKTLADMRVGTVIFDGVTINEGEWYAGFSSPNALVSMGYRTRQVSQTLKLAIKNSNITLAGIPVINGTGAGNETNGYTLDIDVSDSYLESTTAIFRVLPSEGMAANCYVDISVTDGSELYGSTPLTVNSYIPENNITVMLDYGVTSRKPKVGNVILGNDGNGVLDYINGEFESSNIGTVADLWSDNQIPVTDYAYTFVAVGDTQYITDSSNPEKLELLYDWIINNKDSQNIKFVFGMGDITNHSRDDEWPVAMEQINRLNGVVPYSVVRGNHDTTDTFNANLNNETYRSMFDGFYSEDGAENAYVTFSVGEQNFLHITLDYHPSNAVLNWAAGIIQQYPQHKVIISTHDYIQHDGSLSTTGSNGSAANSGEQIWAKLVSQYPNIFLVLSGHVYATDIGRSQMTGVYGNTVTAIMTDGQSHDFKNGPMGFISLLHFSEDGRTMTVEYYSTVHNKFFGKNSQFTLDIPEFDLSQVETPTYLYEIIDPLGHKLSYSDTLPFSMVLESASEGSTVKLLDDADVDSGCDVPANITIDLNGFTLSTEGGRISSNYTVTVKNGTVKIINYELFYVDESKKNSVLTFNNVDIVHTGSTPGKPFLEVRCGSITLDDVRVEAENWKGTGKFMTLSSRTKSESAPLYVTIKNSNISVGASFAVYFGGNSNEVNGYAAYVSFVNSTIAAGRAVSTLPTDAAAAKCSVNVSFDKTTVINCATIFELNKITASNISITVEAGASFAALPFIDGANMTLGGDVFIYSNATSMLTLADSATVDTSKIACKLVKENGDVLCYWEGNQLTKELVTYAQNAACDIVLLDDMAIPAGTSSNNADRYVLTVTIRSLTIDLGGNTLTFGNYSYFGSETNSKTIKLTNGNVINPFYVYYSYSGANTAFEADGVNFKNTTNSASFDVRVGTVTLNNCNFSFTNTPTNVFTLGNNASVQIRLTGCTINAPVNIFKFYAAKPSSVYAENCTFTTGANGAIVFAENSKKLDPADTATFKNCTLSRAGTNVLFNILYSTMTITLDEVYVPGTPKIEPAMGTLVFADGQKKLPVAEGGYMITAPKLNMEANLTLYIDLALNLWLPLDTTVKTIEVGGVIYDIAGATVVNGKYRITIESISAAVAADDMSIVATYEKNELTITAEKTYSVIQYAKTVLETAKYSDEAKALLAYTVKYINSVYLYDGKALPDALTTLMASEAYTAALTLSTANGVDSVPATKTDIGTAGGALKSAKLSITSKVEFILTLNPSYSGSLTLTYAGRTYTYEVVEGQINGADYVQVDMRAFNLYDEVITVTAGEYSGNYDLAAYIEGVRNEYESNDSLEAMLLDLYNYCKEADEYKAYVDASGELN